MLADSSFSSQSSILAKLSAFAKQKSRWTCHFMYGDLYINIILMHCTFYFLVLVFFLINILFWNFSSTTSFFTFIISFFNPSLFLSTTLCLAFYFSFPIFHSLFLCTKIPLTITSLYIQFLNFSFFSSQLSVLFPSVSLVNLFLLWLLSSFHLFLCYIICIT